MSDPVHDDKKNSGGNGGKEPEFGSRLVVLGSIIIGVSSIIRSCNFINGENPTFMSMLLTNGTGIIIAMLGFALIKNKK